MVLLDSNNKPGLEYVEECCVSPVDTCRCHVCLDCPVPGVSSVKTNP